MSGAGVLALVPDLMDRSRLSAAPGTNVLRFAAPTPTAAENADLDGVTLVLVDLARPRALDAVRALRARAADLRIVGFGPHVDRDLLAQAAAAGCNEVLARSVFFGRLAAGLD